jgi:hypothetical protein
MAAHVILPRTHRVFANLKTWALGVYHSLRGKLLQSSLGEFVFPLQSPPHQALRRCSASSWSANPPFYKMLTAPKARA